MKLLKGFKKLLCKHNYELNSRYFMIKHQRVGQYEEFKCSKCEKRKEKRVK